LPATLRGKDFLLKGGELTLAISKKRKTELIQEYIEWANRSQAMYMAEYRGLTMKQIDDLRARVREAGGEFHIVKNTLGQVAFKEANLDNIEKLLTGSTAILFAFENAPGAAKALTEVASSSEFVKIKGGYLEKKLISAKDIGALAELPPLSVMRAQLLGTIMAPASKLVRTLGEPARQVAAVIKAYAEKDGVATEA